MAKNGHQAKAIAFAKSSLWLKNSKCKKTCYKCFNNTLHLCYTKTAKKKQLIFEKGEHFENCQNWPPRKTLCKIVTLGQNFKMQKNMPKTFLQHIEVVLYKKRIEKTANIRKIRLFWKLLKMATKQNRHFGSKIQSAKEHAKNVSTTHCSCSMQKNG